MLFFISFQPMTRRLVRKLFVYREDVQNDRALGIEEESNILTGRKALRLGLLS